MKVVTDYNIIDKQKWYDFVANHRYGTAFQTPEMFEVYKSDKYYEPIIVICFNNSDGIEGLIMSVIQREYRGLLGKLSSRSIIWGAPLLKNDNTEVLNLLLEKYNELVKDKAVYTQVRNLWDTGNFKSEFEKRGYIYEDHLDILINLEKTEEELWSDIYSRRRSQINKSVRSGVSVRMFDDKKLIIKRHDILLDVYKRAKLPLPGEEYFKSAKNIFRDKDIFKFFGAFHNEKLVGVIYLLCFNDRTYEWYIGSYHDYMKKHPNDLIIWEIFKWSKKNNYKLFDFGGAGHPDKEYGVREYKKKFGGTIYNFGRYQKVHNKLLMHIATIGFKIWQFIKFGFKKS